MRPTPAEQLQGTCRILEDIVAPYVAEPFARTILANLIANLRMVTDALPKVTGFVRDDNTAALELLQSLRPALPATLVARIDQAASAMEPDPTDAAALDERNRILRQLLADAVGAPGLNASMRRSVAAYMTERAARVPMRYVPPAAPLTPPPAKA